MTTARSGAARSGRRATSIVSLVTALTAVSAGAQELEPRAYSNAPIGMSFLVAGYATSSGGVLFDPSIALDNAKLDVDGPVVGYARALSLGGLSAKVDAGIGHACVSGSADYLGEHVTGRVCGLSDVKTRLAVNFIGAPALRPQEFAAYRQKLVVGASLQLGVPVGDYDGRKLINVGANRWSAKTEIGFSKALPRHWIVEVSLAGTFYETNDDFRGGRTREEDPIYALQMHAVRNLQSGVWIAVDSTHYRGGQTTTDGVQNSNRQSNDRLGLTLSLPINRAQSVKVYFSSGVSTRTGTDFDTVGAAWQYRWVGKR